MDVRAHGLEREPGYLVATGRMRTFAAWRRAPVQDKLVSVRLGPSLVFGVRQFLVPIAASVLP
jgi:hypothetical protein